jgi:hypothetical protein
MGFKGKIPGTANIRVKGYGRHCRKHKRFKLLARNGKGWDIIQEFSNENKAMERIGHHFADKDAKWSFEVKVRAGWVCEEPNCGEGVGGDKTLLEAHHIESVSTSPDKRNDLDNGKCLCMFHHAMKHIDWARLQILARLGLKLYGRLYPHKKAEIQRMAG